VDPAEIAVGATTGCNRDHILRKPDRSPIGCPKPTTLSVHNLETRNLVQTYSKKFAQKNIYI
jgi:hypothetical protein